MRSCKWEKAPARPGRCSSRAFRRFPSFKSTSFPLLRPPSDPSKPKSCFLLADQRVAQLPLLAPSFYSQQIVVETTKCTAHTREQSRRTGSFGHVGANGTGSLTGICPNSFSPKCFLVHGRPVASRSLCVLGNRLDPGGGDDFHRRSRWPSRISLAWPDRVCTTSGCPGSASWLDDPSSCLPAVAISWRKDNNSTEAMLYSLLAHFII